MATLYSCNRAESEKSTRSKYWRKLVHSPLIPSVPDTDSKSSHMTQKQDSGQVSTEQKDQHLSTGDGNSSQNPAQVSTIPSSREVTTTYDEQFIQLVHDAHSQMMQELQERTKQEEHDLKVAKIEYYLRGSPLSGYGDWMVTEGERTGVNPYLCPAVAEAESSLGRALCGSYNAWGMLGCGFSSWQHGITRWFDNCILHWGAAQHATEMRGYCVPDHPWMENCESVAHAIEAIEI